MENTYNCKEDCLYLRPYGCFLETPNPKEDLSYEMENNKYPDCPFYKKSLGIN